MRRYTKTIIVISLGILLLSLMFGGDKTPRPVTDLQPGLDVTVNLKEQCTKTNGVIDERVFGISVHNTFQTNPATLRAIEDLNVEWIFNGIYWPAVAPQKGLLDLATTYDSFVLEMAKRNVNIVLSIGNYWPAWIKNTDELKTYFKEMVEEVVSRYKPGGLLASQEGLGAYGVRYWEIINEPNFPCCGWGGQGTEQPVNTSLYAELLAIANETIRKQDPNAVIILGGLSPGYLLWPEKVMNPFTFLTDIYEYGAKGCFDVIAYHPYDSEGLFYKVVDDVRSVTRVYGDQDKPIWFNELGSGDVDKQYDLFEKSIAQIDATPAFFWLGMNSFGEQQWGLLDENLKPRQPIYNAVKEYIKKSGGSR